MTAGYVYQPQGSLQQFVDCIWIGQRQELLVSGVHHAALFTELIVSYGDSFEMSGQHIQSAQEGSAVLWLSGLKTRPFFTKVAGNYSAVGLMLKPFCYGILERRLQHTDIRKRLTEVLYEKLLNGGIPDFAGVEHNLLELFNAHQPDYDLLAFEQYVSWHEGGRRTLGLFEDELSITPKGFIQKFKRAYCLTPTDYLRLVQVNEAMGALGRSNERIITIALDCGFYDQAHFTRIFKQYTGCTPGSFRLNPYQVNAVQYG